MLQRTKAEKVAEVYQTFSKTFPSLSDASRSDPEKIRGVLYPLGLRWRNEKIIQLIHEIIERDGEIPIDKKELMKMAGIGEYVSNAYLSLYQNIKAPITDNNAVRLWSRVFNFKIDAETRKKRWFHNLTDRITPDDSFKGFNFAVLDLTRKICRKKPECKICPINKECQYFSKKFI
jgi:A/G-specific adenine glycosylase